MIRHAILMVTMKIGAGEVGWDFKNGQEGLDYYRLLPYWSGN
jgi:hypothetical protein